MSSAIQLLKNNFGKIFKIRNGIVDTTCLWFQTFIFSLSILINLVPLSNLSLPLLTTPSIFTLTVPLSPHHLFSLYTISLNPLSSSLPILFLFSITLFFLEWLGVRVGNINNPVRRLYFYFRFVFVFESFLISLFNGTLVFHHGWL